MMMLGNKLLNKGSISINMINIFKMFLILIIAYERKRFEWVELILMVDDKYQNVGISSNDSILEIGD